jgi:hypothetical protein
LTIVTVDDFSGDRDAARQRLLDRLRRSTLAYGGPLPSRDEIHDRGGAV